MSAHTLHLGPIDRFTSACVERAAARWPAEISRDMAREWHAELAALRGGHAMARTWRAIRFAMSLALSPSVESESPMSAPSPGRLPGLGRALTAAVSVIGVALLATALFRLASSTDEANIDEYYSRATVSVINLVEILIAVAIMGWIGTVAGRRGFAWFRRSPLVSAVLCTAPLGLAMWLVLATPQYRFRPFAGVDPGLAVIAWIVIGSGVLTLALRLAIGRRRIAAWVVGIIGMLIALDLAGMGAGLRGASRIGAGYAYLPAWFPLSMFPNPVIHLGRVVGFPATSGSAQASYYASSDLLGTVGPVVGPLLLCSGFTIAYALRAVRATAPVPAAERSEATAATPVRISTFIRPAGFVGIAIGWTTLAYLLAADMRVTVFDGETANSVDAVWYRLITIAVIAMATVLVLARRGPAAVPAISTFAVLFATDCALSQAHWYGLGAGLMMLIVAAATLAGAWWLAGMLATRTPVIAAGVDTTDTSARRALLGVAVLAPLITLTRINISHPAALTPPALGICAYVLNAVLWLLAITAALASRRTPLGRFATICYVVLPLVVIVVATRQDIGRSFYFDDAAFFVQPLLAIVALAAARWHGGRNDGRIRSVLTWILAGLAATALSNPISDVLQDIGAPFSTALTALDPARLDRFDIGDFPSTVAGQIILAIALAAVVARWAYPQGPEAERAATVDPNDEPSGEETGHAEGVMA